jgi:hypothetical protein
MIVYLDPIYLDLIFTTLKLFDEHVTCYFGCGRTKIERDTGARVQS